MQAPQPPLEWAQQLTEAGARSTSRIAAGVALLGLAYLGVCVAGRAGSAWPLEWMEGASLAHATRLLHGAPLYAAPSGSFIPFVYPPLSYLPMALAAAVWGPALWAARLPSLLALAVCLVALGRAAQYASGQRAAGWLAAGLFALGYGYCGAFIDLARVDAVFMALCAWGVERSCARRHGASVCLFALACFAKQHAVFFLLAASLGALLEERRAAWKTVLATWAAVGCGVSALAYATDGWFWTYCFSVPARHGLEPKLLLSFLVVDVCLYLPLLSGLTGYAAWRTWREASAEPTDAGSKPDDAEPLGPGTDPSEPPPSAEQSPLTATSPRPQTPTDRAADPRSEPHAGVMRSPAGLTLLLLLAAGVVASALGRAHPGGDDNVRLPGYALLCVVGACAFCRLCERARTPVAWCGLLALQIAMLVQAPALYWPSPQSDAYFTRLRAELARCAGAGDAVALDHALFAGRPFAHTLALSDLRMNGDALSAQATRAVLDALRAPHAPAAISLSVSFPELSALLAERYEPCARLPAVRLPTGYGLSPSFVYSRRR